MTQQVDVYILGSVHTDARLTFLSKLVNKCFQRSLKTLVVSDNISWLNQIDIALWNLPRFIAHERLDDALLSPIPSILLATPDALARIDAIDFKVDVCIDELEALQTLNYPRILIVADQEVKRLDIGRQKYQHYQQKGVEPLLHRLDNSS